MLIIEKVDKFYWLPIESHIWHLLGVIFSHFCPLITDKNWIVPDLPKKKKKFWELWFSYWSRLSVQGLFSYYEKCLLSSFLHAFSLIILKIVCRLRSYYYTASTCLGKIWYKSEAKTEVTERSREWNKFTFAAEVWGCDLLDIEHSKVFSMGYR